MALEPSLWGTLPKELLHLVFACLPVVGIGQLRVLSKEWKRNIDCKDSEFNQLFDATTLLNMFALLPRRYSHRMSWSCDIYDVQADKWHVYETEALLTEVISLASADGGLVCFVSKWKWYNNEPGYCIVMNPLTKQKMQLPPLLCMGAEKSNTLVTTARMVKLTVDRKTKEYKVFVVSSITNSNRGSFAQVYDSHTKEWMVVEATQGHIIGWDCIYNISNMAYNFTTCRLLCVYNCANRTLQHFNESSIALGLKVEPECCELVEDHLFVLHKEASLFPADLLKNGESVLPKYCISEFHLPKKSTAWVKLRVHSCGPSKCFLDSQSGLMNSILWGCNSFLLVYVAGSKHAWLYNLSTCEWRTLPAFRRPLLLRMMCSISWSAIT